MADITPTVDDPSQLPAIDRKRCSFALASRSSLCDCPAVEVATPLRPVVRNSLDQTTLEGEKHDECWNETEHRHRHQLPVAAAGRIDERPDPTGTVSSAGDVRINELREEVVVGPDEGEDNRCRQSRCQQRQDDAHEHLEGAAAIDDRSVVELARMRRMNWTIMKMKNASVARNFGTISGSRCLPNQSSQT